MGIERGQDWQVLSFHLINLSFAALHNSHLLYTIHELQTYLQCQTETYRRA